MPLNLLVDICEIKALFARCVAFYALSNYVVELSNSTIQSSKRSLGVVQIDAVPYHTTAAIDHNEVRPSMCAHGVIYDTMIYFVELQPGASVSWGGGARV